MERRFTRWVNRLRRNDSQQATPMSSAPDKDAALGRDMALNELAEIDPLTRDAVQRIREGRTPGRLTSPRTGDSPYLSVLVNDETAKAIQGSMDRRDRTPDEVVDRAIWLLGNVERSLAAGKTFYVKRKTLFGTRTRRIDFPW